MSEKATMLGASTSCLGPPKHFSGWKNMDSIWFHASLLSSWHFLTLPDTSWHFLTLPDTSWHCLTLPDTAWHFLTLPDTSWHFLTLPDSSFPISPTFWAPFPFCSVHGLSRKNVKHGILLLEDMTSTAFAEVCLGFGWGQKLKPHENTQHKNYPDKQPQ